MRAFGLVTLVATLVGLPAASVSATPTYIKRDAGEFRQTNYVGSSADLNGDGYDDLIVGSTNDRASLIPEFGMPLPPPLPVDFLLSNGDGTFRDGTAELVAGDLPRSVGPPIAVVADFNGDGRPDVAIFDRGITLTNANLSGSPPILLLSGPDGRLHRSSALADAVAILHQRYPFFGQYGGPNLHVYVAVAGDIDNDGDIDIWVESCGGNNACSHFLVNNGDGTFTADEGRVSVEALRGPPGQFWRYWGAALADMDGDGFLDLVQGQLRKSWADGRQDLATSAVFLNDRTGYFPSAGSIRLPQPDFNLAFTSVDSLAVADIDGDGLKDIVLAHARAGSSTDVSVVPFTGRYIQILINQGSGQFVDETLVRMGDQSATSGQISRIYPAICPGTSPCVPGGGGPLKNAVFGLTIEDVDGDGYPDLVMSHANAFVGREGPLVHLNDGAGRFTVLDPNRFTFGDLFVHKPIAMDVNGDGIVDFVYANSRVGAPTNTYVALVAQGPGTVSFVTPTMSTAETGSATLNLRRVGGTVGDVTVTFRTVDGSARAGVDYTARNDSVTFGPGQTTRTLTVPILPNELVDGDRAFTVELTSISPASGALGSPATATVTIRNDDVGGTVKVGTPAVAVLEGDAATVTIVRAGGAGGGVSVSWTAEDISARAGADYTAASGTVTFGPRETMKSITVPTLADGLAEGDETFRMRLHTPVGLILGTPAAATVTLKDADQGFVFSAPEYRITEGTPAAAVKVLRTGPTTGMVTVRYGTAPGSATPGMDYTPAGATLTFGPGVKEQSFMVPVANDTTAEGLETVLLALTDPTGGALLGPQAAATLWILDNDLPGQIKLGAAAHTVAEAAGTVTVTVQRVGTAGDVTVAYRTQDGSAIAGQDYLAAQGTLTFGPGETTKTFTVRVLSDTLDEPSETFTVLLENPGGGATLGVPASALVTVTDDDVSGVLAFSLAAYQVPETAGRATVVVTRTGGQAGGVTVDLEVVGGAALEDADWTGSLPARLIFAPGEMSKSLVIAITDDADREGNEAIFLRLVNPGGGATLGAISTTAIVIGDNEVGPIVAFSLERLSVDETSRTATVNVVRSQAGAGQSVILTVDTSASGGRVAPEAPRVIAFTPTQLSVPVILTLTDNQSVQPDGQVTLTLSSPAGGLALGSASSFVLSIRDNDALLQFAPASLATSVSEGAAAQLTVERSGALGTLVTVRWTAVNGTALAPGDYAAASGTLTFAPGVTSQVIRVATANDVVPEGTETFTVTLSAPTGGGVLGSQATATVSITPDADAAGEFQLSADVTVLEGGVATLQLIRTGGQGGPVVVNYQTEDGTATVAGGDYVSKNGSLTFVANVLSQNIMITTRTDAVVEGPETLRVRLSLPAGSLATLGARDTAMITLIDAQTARVQLGAPAYSVSESAGVLPIPVSRMGPTTQASTVQWAVTPGTALGGGIDYTAAGGTLTFPAGSTAAQSLTVALTNDLLAEPTKTFTVVLSAPSAATQVGAPGAALVTLTDDDIAGQVQFGAAASAVVEGQTALLTLLRTNGLASGVEVGVVIESSSTATAGEDYAAFTQTHVFAAGESMKVVAIPTNAGGLREGAEVLRLRLQVTAGGAVVGALGTAELWIVDDVQTLRFIPSAAAVAEGGTAVVTVARGGAPSGPVTVGYRVLGGTATNGADYTVGGTGSLSFAPGVSNLTFQVATVNDVSAEGPETVVLELVDPVGAALDPDPGRFTLTILDNERPDLAVTSVGAPTQAATGLPMNLVVTVRNLSAASAPASTLAIFLSSSVVPGSGIQLAPVSVPALAGRTGITLTPIVNVPPGLAAGDYFVSAVVNPAGTLVEETLSNNGATAAGATDVIELRPDLIVTSVPAPGSMLTGKMLSSPLHVRNAGPAASGPFRVGVYLSQDQSPGNGLLLAIRDMPSLAPGTGADVPLAINLPDDLAQGDYYLTGAADLLGVVTESDELNNALVSAVPFRVNRNLTKLRHVSASFQTPFAGCNPQIAGRNLALTGTLNLTSQTGTTGQGTITLTGSPDGISSVTFRGSFSATVLQDDTVTIAFSVTASGAFTGTAAATGTGAITDGILRVDPINGTLTVTGLGPCPFTGDLEVRGEIALFFSLLFFAEGGLLPPSGTGSATPVFLAPLAISAGSLGVAVLFDPAPPIDPFFVKFTGPPGSGVVNAPAELRLDVTAGSFYETDTASVAGRNVVGTWSVNYGGRFTRTFTVGNPEAEARFIAMLPTLTRDGSNRVTAVSWVFKDRRTGATVPAPPHADSIQMELVGSFAGIGPNPEFGYYASPDFPRTTTSHTLPAPVPFAQIEELYISFKDTLTGNFYVTTYRR